MSRVIRVFPRKNNATPDDPLAAVCRPPTLWDEADKVLVSVSFDWDMEYAEELAKQWGVVAPVEIGGPAYFWKTPAGEFEPGMFLKKGYVITSRGCPNRCYFCKVPTREGDLRTLEVKEGWNLLDNNILACPEDHQRKVFEMLLRQKEAPRFTGGIEACRVTAWHADWFLKLMPESLWMAYDMVSDWEPLVAAVSMFKEAGLVAPHKTKRIGCYVLMGFSGDTPEAADKRCQSVIELGIKTQAMLFDNGALCQECDMEKWWNLRKKYTNAAEVGAMVAETWKTEEETLT